MAVSLGKPLRVQSGSRFFHGGTTAPLALIGEKADSLHVLLRQEVPALFRPYTPTWWMPLGDLQTIYSSVFHRRKEPRVHYERKYILVPDGGCISMDITPPISSKSPPDTPIVIVLHGLLGGSHVSYIRSAVAQLTKPTHEGGLGLRAVAFNLRGCSKTPVTSPLLYHPGMTDDLRSVVLYVSSQYPNAKLFGLGFSLGAGYLTNYLGEEGDQSPLIAGFNVSNVWDYSACSLELSHGRLLSRTVYNPLLGKGHQRIIKRNRQAFGFHSELDNLLNKRLVTMSWFTGQFMSQTAGVDPIQFLHDTSCAKSIPNIQVPLLCLNAHDDPLLPANCLPVNQVRESKHVMMVVTERGGHLGWFEDARDELGEFEPWYTPAIVQYFRMMLRVRENGSPLNCRVPLN
ncbi:AB-hydrolase YheT [Hysterangium stoloniferum]|nr:AB-hydrolase YheT [Hysterangium stoloniferum]